MSSPTEIPLAQRAVEDCMGTTFSFDIRYPGVDRSALASVIAWLHWVDATFSTYRRDSQINRLARNELSLSECAPEVREILRRCDALEVETGGYFSAHATGRLDPSGLVKGWAIQRASEMLAAAGSRNHCVNGGGDVQCLGSARSGTQWRVGIAHPLRRTDLVGIAAGHDMAVATSGSAERGNHIVNPHTPTAAISVASVTLIGRELATTDAYATAAFARGTDAPAWLSTLSGFVSMIVYSDGTEWASHPTASASLDSPTPPTAPRLERTPSCQPQA